jgi:hypothetical protein
LKATSFKPVTHDALLAPFNSGEFNGKTWDQQYLGKGGFPAQ